MTFLTFLSLVGVHCEMNLDDCIPSTDPLTNEPKCFNNGKCVDRIGGYQCVCPPGYVGERCEGDVNECLSDPCDPRGSYNCIQLTNSYRCECRTGYTGTDVHVASLILTGECFSAVSKWYKASRINLVCVPQASVVTKCLMAVKDDPAGMEEHVLWLVTHHMVSSANVHL